MAKSQKFPGESTEQESEYEGVPTTNKSQHLQKIVSNKVQKVFLFF